MRFALTMMITGAVALGATPRLVGGQTTGTPLEVGTMAPDFQIPGATRYGVLRDQVRLSDFRGHTVVLAFFYRARSRG